MFKLREYLPVLTAVENQKGVLDVDTVKGCTLGMRANMGGAGCYDECYAFKTAQRFGIDFSVSVSRKLTTENSASIYRTVKTHRASWYRIGVAGDPCHDWDHTLDVCEFLRGTGKTPVIITKHWIVLGDGHLDLLKGLGAVINTSVSGIDTPAQTRHRLRQIKRIAAHGVRSVARVVTCEFGDTEFGRAARDRQERLMSLPNVIDNPLRSSKNNEMVLRGDIKLTRRNDSIGGGKFVSLHDKSVYLGKCSGCPDQCGAAATVKRAS
jgi:hypothetical protein